MILIVWCRLEFELPQLLGVGYAQGAGSSTNAEQCYWTDRTKHHLFGEKTFRRGRIIADEEIRYHQNIVEPLKH